VHLVDFIIRIRFEKIPANIPKFLQIKIIYPDSITLNVSCLLGWGTLEYTGPKSDRLMKTQLDVVDINKCQQVFGSKVSTTSHLCTYRSGTDACQVTHSSIYIHSSSGYCVILPY